VAVIVLSMRIDVIARTVAAAGLLLAVHIRPLRAQQPAAPASISGFAYDSLRNRPMAGAQIVIQGTSFLTVAGADGHFRFDSVPAGQYRLLAAHPILDSIGIQLTSPPIKVAVGQALTIDMVTPGPAGLVKMLCPAARLALGPAALFGRVRNADTEQPIAQARVSIVWTDIQMGGLQKIPKIRGSDTDANGTYRICGLPTTFDGKVQVQHAGVTSGDVPISFSNDELEVRSLSIAVAAPVTVARGDTNPPPRRPVPVARLTGHVFSVTGQPVAGARVQIEGTPRAANSGEDGSFRLDSLPSGSQVVVARRIGYDPVEQSVELSASSPATTTLRFDQAVTLLPTVTTEAKRVSGLDEVGFTQRQQSGMGFYMDEKAVDQRGAPKFTDLLRTVPGIRVQTSGYDTQVYDARTQGTGCVTYVVDGSPWVSVNPGDIDSFVLPDNVGAVEVYHGAETPPQFQSAGRGGCAAIIIWTKWWLNRHSKKK
jgi:Carboxypeptidase regulatory-like domain/TonB-dependent Receptor Plug Domain